jgi:hypothetical protein
MQRFDRIRVWSLLGSVTAATALIGGCAPVQRWNVTRPPTASPAKDFDVIWETGSIDPNGAPLNPSWATQQTNLARVPPQSAMCQGTTAPFSNVCTAQMPSTDPAAGVHKIVCSLDQSDFHGHANWLVATLTGYSSWYNWATDDDMNMYFVPDNRLGGIAAANKTLPAETTQYLDLEFSHWETFGLFATDWWTHVGTLIDRWARSANDASAINAALNEAHPGRMVRTSVFGLFGLDCEHGCRSEVHPVYALALETDDDPRRNKWAIFARNSGTEGYCSHKDHELSTSNNVVRVLLPKKSLTPPMVRSDRMQFASTYPNTPIPQIDFVANEGLVVSFALQSPDAAAISELVLEADWGAVAGAQLPAVAATSPAAPTLGPEAAGQAESAALPRGEQILGSSIRERYQLAPPAVRAGNQRNAGIDMGQSTYLPRAFDPERPMSTAPLPPVHDSSRTVMNRKEADDRAAVEAACMRSHDALAGLDRARSTAVCRQARKP